MWNDGRTRIGLTRLGNKGQSTYSKSTVETGKMALSATKVAKAPACFTANRMPMFILNGSGQSRVDWSSRAEHVVMTAKM